MARAGGQTETLGERDQAIPGRFDFSSAIFDSTLSHLLGESVVKRARELKGSSAFQRRISEQCFRSDTPADNLVKAIRRDRAVAGQLKQALAQGVDDAEGASEELVAFMRSAERIPAFIDRQKVAEGGRVFRSKLDLFGLITYGFPVGIYLQGMDPAITMSLLFTNRPTREPASIETVLARKESKRRGMVRILETFRWFNAVAEQGAGELYSDEFAENCRIRIVHAHVRAAISGHQAAWQYQPPFGWDHQELGLPLSAADGSIVVSTIVVTLLAMRRHLHKAISEEEMDALNHWSNYVSYLQGVPEQLLCERYEDTVVQFAAFIMSMDTTCYQEQLAGFMGQLQNLGMGQGLLRKHKPLAKLLDGLADAALDAVFAPEVKARFGIRTGSTGSRLIYTSLCQVVSLVNRSARISRRVNSALDRQTVKMWRIVIPEAERLLSRMHGQVVG